MSFCPSFFRTSESSAANDETFIVYSIAVGSNWDAITVIPETFTYAAIFGLAALGLVIPRSRLR